jgi:uncharacterized protein (TIGR00297 family)
MLSFIQIPFPDLIVYIVLLAGIVFSVSRNKLTIPAAIVGGIVGLFIYKGAGFTGLAMLILFFILGSFATNWLITKKEELGIAENNSGRRTTGQVVANGGMAAILGAIAWYKPWLAPMLKLLMAGGLSAATADTLSSELGSVYGHKFYDILSFKRSKPGPDGVVSLEGTLFGIAGSALIALIYSIGFGFGYTMLIVIVAGTVGNLTDSFLGASLERKHLIGNNAVNFLNTTVGALMCLLLYIIGHTFVK